ncbi:MAG: HAD family phosphatase [Anaerolineales bacterium]
MSIEAIFWDMGGVIMRTDDQTPRAKLAEQLGLSYADLANQVFGSPESLRAQLGEITAQQFWEATSARYAMSPKDFIADFFRGDLIDQELVSAIRKLKANYKTGLLSNAFSDLRSWIRDEWKFGDAFSQMVISAEVRIMKPDPAIYALAMKQLDVEPQSAVFVDDLHVNIEGAQEAGMHGIVFKSTVQTLGDLQALLGGN